MTTIILDNDNNLIADTRTKISKSGNEDHNVDTSSKILMLRDSTVMIDEQTHTINAVGISGIISNFSYATLSEAGGDLIAYLNEDINDSVDNIVLELVLQLSDPLKDDNGINRGFSLTHSDGKWDLREFKPLNHTIVGVAGSGFEYLRVLAKLFPNITGPEVMALLIGKGFDENTGGNIDMALGNNLNHTIRSSVRQFNNESISRIKEAFSTYKDYRIKD